MNENFTWEVPGACVLSVLPAPRTWFCVNSLCVGVRSVCGLEAKGVGEGGEKSDGGNLESCSLIPFVRSYFAFAETVTCPGTAECVPRRNGGGMERRCGCCARCYASSSRFSSTRGLIPSQSPWQRSGDAASSSSPCLGRSILTITPSAKAIATAIIIITA